MKNIIASELPNGTDDLFVVRFYFEQYPQIRRVEKNENYLIIDLNPFPVNFWDKIDITELDSESINTPFQGKEYLKFYLKENKYFKPFKEKYQHLLGDS